MNDLQDELVKHLFTDLGAANIHVIQSDVEVFSVLSAKFPVRSSGIAWEEVPHHECAPSMKTKMSKEEYRHTIDRFLNRFSLDAGILETDDVYVAGDGPTDLAFRMPLSVFKRNATWFFEIPQSTFVVKQ